jgi:ATP-dependent DNA helicase RecG
MDILPISLDDLVHSRRIESARLEFKGTWSDLSRDQTIRTVSAFANDLHNLNGGYIVIGIDESGGQPVLPPRGLGAFDLDQLQREIRGACERIEPKYFPLISPEVFLGQSILVLWCPGGDVRPYSAPESSQKGSDRHYYVRVGSETVVAKREILTQLMQLTARVPFDDRLQRDVSPSAVSESLLHRFLLDIRSNLGESKGNLSVTDLLIHMRLADRINGAIGVRNAALLFFVENPESYFPGARIEVVQFGDDTGGSLIEERQFRGPLPQQIRNTLEYLDGLSASVIRKVPREAEAQRFVAFPYEAMEEAVSNAVLHRSYDGVVEPTKVYLYPDRLEITSYPGPVPGVERPHFERGAHPPQAPMRNRRIGEFLKELRLAEMRGTGIPTIRRRMAENGSPEPRFEFDDARTYFRVVLPAHPDYVVLHALRESAQLWATGDRERAILHLESARRGSPQSGAIIAQIIDYAAASGDLAKAKGLFEQTRRDAAISGRHLPFFALARAYLDQGQTEPAREILSETPEPASDEQLTELAILQKRSGEHEKAHRLFADAFSRLQNSPKAVHEFAQTKLKLADKTRRQRRGAYAQTTVRRLYREALELLRRVVQLADNPVRSAWAWFDIARVSAWLRLPETEVIEACDRAIGLLPDEPRFQEWRRERERRKT